MLQRIFSTIVLWGLVIGLLLWVGPPAGMWLLTVLSALALWEFYRLLEATGLVPWKTMGIVSGIAIMFMSYYAPLIGGSFAMLAISSIVLGCSVLAHRMNPDWLKLTLCPTLFGIVYVPWLLSSYVEITRDTTLAYDSTTALVLVIWLIAVAKFTDIGGLLVGLTVGKHRLAPSISPKKSWEGVLGGAVFSTLGGMGLLYLFKNQLPVSFTMPKAFLLALIITPLSVVSDLFKSVLKRQAGVKDSGKFIPGIGGALDLVDSLLFTAPIGSLYLQYFVIG